MGYIKHNAIVVTCWNSEKMVALGDHARELGMQVLGPSPALMNGYRSILICPDGSKEGWADSEQGDARRAALRTRLVAEESLEWCEVSYGHDDGTAEIVAHAWVQDDAA
jgi:hypothetical protein